MCWSWMGPLVVCATLTLSDAECHCNTTTACDVFPSTPCSQVGDPDRCQEGWFGKFCQKQNIALRRPCNQSSTLNHRIFGADRGVDGSATTVLDTPRTCTHTEQERNPTWTVNLNTSVPEKIQHIRLYLRDGYLDRNIGMEILVGSQMCYNWSSTEHPPPIANVTCRQPLTGTTITVRIPGQGKVLTLCEVQIYVCSDGWFSEDCDKQCRCLNSIDVCDKITGHCSSGCLPGYNGTDCQTECPDGFYGINCSSRCGNCLDGASCTKNTGTCPGGCAAGWMTGTCQQACPDGSYSINCASKCGNCLHGVSCNKATGTCPGGCAAGWMNDNTKLCLQQCPDGSYGINCTSRCGNCLDGVSCDKITGTCPGGCAVGWMIDDTNLCQQKCPDGSYGINCTSRCGNCLDGVSCDKITGACPGGCAAGWMNGDTKLCRKPCPHGFYGTNCASLCGNCFNSVSCDKSNGTCPRGCAAGWVNDGTCLQLTPTGEGFNWGVPVAVVLSVLLIVTVIGAAIYIRRLLKQLESLKNKASEEHYVTLDETTKVAATESTYEHIGNTTPYYNTVDCVQDKTG